MTLQEIFDVWDNAGHMADDVGVSRICAYQWMRRGRIPGRYDVQLMLALAPKGKTVTFADLAQIRSDYLANNADGRIKRRVAA